MAKQRAAVVGCGGMGRHHLRVLRDMPEVEVRAVCEIMPERLQQAGDEFGVDRRYARSEEMYDKEKLDLVVIATQVKQHRDLTVEAAARGAHVLCEKPMALDLREADDMVEACERAGVFLAINHQGHCHPATTRAKAMLDAGEIGELLFIRGHNKGGRKCGNEMMEMGTHVTDRMLVYGGEATWCNAWVTWQGRPAGVGDIMEAQEMSPRDRDSGLALGDRAFAQYGFTNCPAGEMAFFAHERTDVRSYGVDLVGAEGQLALRHSSQGLVYHLPQAISFAGDGQDPWRAIDISEELREDPIAIMVRQLVRAADTGRPHPSSGAVGRGALEMVMGIWESHRRRNRVEFPLQPRDHPLVRWRAEEGGNS